MNIFTLLLFFFFVDVLTPLPTSPGDFHHAPGSSVVVIRSLSNKTSFDSPDEFYQQMHQSEIARSSPIHFQPRHCSSNDTSMIKYSLGILFFMK